MEEFPTRPEQVTREWLSAVLGTRVDGLRWEAIGTGQVADTVRLHLSGAPGLPATVAAKFPSADPVSRATAAMFGLYRKEVEFYRNVAPHLAVRLPRLHFAAVDGTGEAFVLVFEDCGPARGGDQIAGCSLDDARAAMRAAAAIHAPSWGRGDLLEPDWLAPPPDQAERLCAMYPQAHSVFRDRYASLLEPEFMALCEELAARREALFSRSDAPQCVVHGDYRLDNMLFAIRGGAEPIAILDWQTVTAGRAMTDIGYFLGCGIGQLGITHEDELLGLYLAEMNRRGVALDDAAIERDYRLGILHGVTTAVFSAAFVARTSRGDANFLSMARGACALALHRDSLAPLREMA